MSLGEWVRPGLAWTPRAAPAVQVAAVVVRIDSPGGDALASDLMWREVRQLAAEKPVVASMGDVAASGGYYLAMGAPTVVCEPLTITGSIGVITGKVNLAELYRRAGYTKQLLSRGRYAELLAESRGMTPDEATLFAKSAEHAYASFRDKAAESRGMSIDAMQASAPSRRQGRCCAALQRHWGLVQGRRWQVCCRPGANRMIRVCRDVQQMPLPLPLHSQPRTERCRFPLACACRRWHRVVYGAARPPWRSGWSMRWAASPAR